ncbi:HYR domain-containing protein, partial [Umezakia ovalisporum]|uniref:HYR domain-containing protein n=1 Tax=Umezakia ovalisporum TaxID=75695 RepID=UPI0039C72A17
DIANIKQLPAPGTVLSTGRHTITLTATDKAGNESTCTFDVIVRDVTAPSLTCPGNQIVDANVNCQTTLVDYTGLA